MKKMNKKGFTLAELLIVVAIIAILVAIGIPVFSTAMERSRETVDLANIRAAYAEFQSGQLSGSGILGGVYKIDFKQTDSKGWLIDTSGLRNLLAPNSSTSGASGTTDTYALDTPETAGSAKNAVNFWVAGDGKPKMQYVTFEAPDASKLGVPTGTTNIKIAISDTNDGKTPPAYTFDANKTTYYLYEKG